MPRTSVRPRSRRRIGVMSAALAAITLVSACGTSGDDPAPAGASPDISAAADRSPEPNPAPAPGTAAESGSATADGTVTTGGPVTADGTVTAGGPVTATDPHGAELSLPATPERIVCLTGLCDDVLVELGVTPIGSSTPGLLERPEFLGDKASEVTTIPGGFGTEDIESIAALEPDLVVGLAGVHDQNRDAIEQYAPLLVVEVTSYAESLAYLEFFGELTGRSEQAQQGVAVFNESLERARTAAEEHHLGEVTALAMYWNAGTVGVNTDDDLLGALFAEIFDYPWANKGGDYTEQAAYSVEEILKNDPEYIFMQSYTATPQSPKGNEELSANPVWRNVDAVKNDRVLEVDTSLWTAGRGPRVLSLVLDQAIDFVTG